MDTIDRQILDFLQNDAMMTAKEMAAKLSLTPTPIYERIKKLEKKGIIKSYVALLDAEKLGKTLTVFMNFTIKEHHVNLRRKFLEQMLSLNEVVELYHTSGTFDFLAKVRFSNIKEYRDFLVNKVSTIENISDIDSQIVLEELKCSTTLCLTSLLVT